MRRKPERQKGETSEKVEQKGKEQRRRRRHRSQESVGRRHRSDRQLGVGCGGRSHLGVEVAAEVDDFESDSHSADSQVGRLHTMPRT